MKEYKILTPHPLYYSDGCKYQVREGFTCYIPALKEYNVEYGFIHLYKGYLTLKAGFAPDGASGPTIDTKSSFRGSFIHDAIYKLIRQGLLPASCKEIADSLLYTVCVRDKMWRWRAKVWFRSVVKFAGHAIDPKNKIKVRKAP